MCMCVISTTVTYSRACSWPSPRGWSSLTLARMNRGGGGGDIFNKPLSCCLLGVPIVTFVVSSSVCATLTAQNVTENNFIISSNRTHDCTSSQCILSGIHWLLVARKERSCLPSANHCQSHIQTPQSGTVVLRVSHIQMLYPWSTSSLHFIWPQNSVAIFICFSFLFSCYV
jgi:hypothetical protein